jgi:hypothetical protein
MVKITLMMDNGDQRHVECSGYSIDQAFFRAKVNGGELIIAMDKVHSIFVPSTEQPAEAPVE